ncbi:unnamed protein product [Caretta caretta]
MVEKCTRLHIHYAHRLCEEPMSCFDAKISFENMTKCLQILKERYQDLDNQDIYCNNEVEFRDYSVLLSLSKGYSQTVVEIWPVPQFSHLFVPCEEWLSPGYHFKLRRSHNPIHGIFKTSDSP